MLKDIVKFTVFGEPASKANSRKIVVIKGKTAVIKSKKALQYAKDFALQCPKLDPLMEGDLSVTITIYYASRRPDLDEAVILDCMQAVFKKDPKGQRHMTRGGIYANDRQVREKHVFWALDRDNPRAEIKVEQRR